MRPFTALLFLCFFSSAAGQYFSGEITYRVQILPKNDSIDISEVVNRKHGSESKYLITAKHYKATYFKNGAYSYSYTYDDDTKRMYDDYAEKAYLTYRDSRKYNFEYFESDIHKDSVIQVLDKTCFLVKSKAEYGTSKTYYSDEIKVDYSDFEGHKIGNWYNKLKEVDGCIMIKSITELKDYFEVMEAIKIDRKPVNLEEFSLPDKPVAASYTALDKRVALSEPTPKQIKCYQERLQLAKNFTGKPFKSFVTFILDADAEISHLEAFEKDEQGYSKIAIDILENCGLEFIPGEINGEKVASQVYFPVDFQN